MIKESRKLTEVTLDVNAGAWRKSSHSGGGSNCLEVNDSPAITFSAPAWSAALPPSGKPGTGRAP
ncbi:DUF397 domain-containing protein [Streptomyces sp. 2A115]|uniref:DUF397 domain-containing protein n=1 Tax=Streptomyces sp. 2A115 TaxID=3457439 RepID=UPI003FD117B8